MSDASLLHREPEDLSDRFALGFTKTMRFLADVLFAKRYGHRAVVLETVAAVPGMVGGTMQHLRCLRRIEDDQGWIRKLLDEAENERMHLMVFVHISRPSRFERALIMVAQIGFYAIYFLIYLISSKTAHRVSGYFEEQAIVSYTEYLHEVESGAQPNVRAPQIAIEYWNLAPDAKLWDVIRAARDDEARHRDENHEFADQIKAKIRP